MVRSSLNGASDSDRGRAPPQQAKESYRAVGGGWFSKCNSQIGQSRRTSTHRAVRSVPILVPALHGGSDKWRNLRLRRWRQLTPIGTCTVTRAAFAAHIKAGFRLLGVATVSHTGSCLVGEHSFRNGIDQFLAAQRIHPWLHPRPTSWQSLIDWEDPHNWPSGLGQNTLRLALRQAHRQREPQFSPRRHSPPRTSSLKVPQNDPPAPDAKSNSPCEGGWFSPRVWEVMPLLQGDGMSTVLP